RADLGIHAELLRQVTQHAPCRGFVGQHVDVAEPDTAFVRVLQGRDRAHQRRLSRAVRAEQSEHPVRDVQRYTVERTHTVRIGLGKIADGQHRWLQGCGYWGQSADENTVCHPPLVTVTFGSGCSVHDESGQMRETGRLAAFPESKEATWQTCARRRSPTSVISTGCL